MRAQDGLVNSTHNVCFSQVDMTGQFLSFKYMMISFINGFRLAGAPVKEANALAEFVCAPQVVT